MLFTARDLMQTGTPLLSFDTHVTQAIEFLGQTHLPFAVVSASPDRLHGVLTEANMMGIFLRYQSKPQHPELIHYREYFEPAQLILETETFPDVIKKLMSAVGHRVFVINAKGNVIGFIQAKNVLPVLTGIYAKNQKPESPEGQTAMQHLQKQLLELKSDLFLYESFFTNSPFMMHSADRKGNIQMANEMLHEALGYTYGDLIGKTIFDIYPAKNHESAREGLKRILSDGYHKPIQTQMVTQKKETIEVELSSRALKDPDQNYIGTITISRPLDMAYHLAILEENA